MEVLSTSGRGAHTLYRVRRGGQLLTLTREELPEGVFRRWRRHQAAMGMRRGRERQSNEPQPAHSAQTIRRHVQDGHQDNPIDLTRSPSSPQAVPAKTEDKDTQVYVDECSHELVSQRPGSSGLSRRSPSPEVSIVTEERETQVDFDKRVRDLVKCKVCKEVEVQKLVVPCGHLVMCDNCLKMWLSQKNQCPLCRTDIKDHFGVFLVE